MPFSSFNYSALQFQLSSTNRVKVMHIGILSCDNETYSTLQCQYTMVSSTFFQHNWLVKSCGSFLMTKQQSSMLGLSTAAAISVSSSSLHLDSY